MLGVYLNFKSDFHTSKPHQRIIITKQLVLGVFTSSKLTIISNKFDDGSLASLKKVVKHLPVQFRWINKIFENENS